jgi:arylsulfatase A-like enzyme
LAVPALGVLVVAHVHLWAYDLAWHPQPYAARLYARGGARALLQIAVSDGLGRVGVGLSAAAIALAWIGVPLGRAWVARRRRAALGVVAAGAALLLGPLWLFGPSPRRASASRPTRPNVLLIAADSLRADRVEPRVAPTLSRLADRGTRFDRAYVSLPRTFPSWVSLLSGKDPHHHGIRHMFPRWGERAADVGAIPREFARAGYHTAVVSDFAGDIFRRIDFGFVRNRTPTFNMRELVREVVVGGQSPILPLLRARAAQRALPVLRELHDAPDADALSRDALDEIDRAGSKPFFVTVFYSTTHFPYAAPAPFASHFMDRSYRGPYRYGKTPSLGAEQAPGPEDVKAVRALYDGAVAAVDDAVATLLAGLTRRGLADDTLIVLTSDHGESLYEPGRGQGHGDHLFGDESTHVPLVIVDPRKPGGQRVPGLVRSVDVAPTVCELAGVQCAEACDGRSLAPALAGQPLPPKPVFAETGIWFTRDIPDLPAEWRLPYPDLTEVLEVDAEHDGDLAVKRQLEPLLVTAKHRMVRDERVKLVYVPTRRGTRWVLYDTEADPGETRDLAAERPEEVKRLSAELWRWLLEDAAMVRQGDMLLPKAGPRGAP